MIALSIIRVVGQPCCPTASVAAVEDALADFAACQVFGDNGLSGVQYGHDEDSLVRTGARRSGRLEGE